jgi:hypothetical protein
MSEQEKRRNGHPFIIHASEEPAAFPTHTHFITELGIGMPEFIMDPLAFGPKGNSRRINAVYDYLRRVTNQPLIESMKNGEILRIDAKDLLRGSDEEYTYRIRRVPPTFEAVKQAYVLKSKEDILNMPNDIWFAQIYVEGDDFALTDEYYKGGVKW